MIADKYIELIHREIDGVNSPQASAGLKAYLAADAEAQRFYNELIAMSGMLKEVKPVEPPAHLQPMIMNMLPPDRYAPRPRRGLLATMREWLETKFNFKYAYVFAGGLTMGIVMYGLLLQTTVQPNDWSKLSGAMIPREEAKNLKTITELEIAATEVSGKIGVKKSAQMVESEVALVAGQPVEMIIGFDEQTMRFQEFQALNETPENLRVTAGTITLRHTGQKNYAIRFAIKSGATGRVEFKILRAEKPLYERTIFITASP